MDHVYVILFIIFMSGRRIKNCCVFEAIIYVYKYEYDGYCESPLVTDLVTPDLVVTAAVGNKRNVIVTDRDAYHL